MEKYIVSASDCVVPLIALQAVVNSGWVKSSAQNNVRSSPRLRKKQRHDEKLECRIYVRMQWKQCILLWPSI